MPPYIDRRPMQPQNTMRAAILLVSASNGMPKQSCLPSSNASIEVQTRVRSSKPCSLFAGPTPYRVKKRKIQGEYIKRATSSSDRPTARPTVGQGRKLPSGES